MTAESLERILADLTQAFNAHDAERVAGYYAKDYTGFDVSRAGPHQGREGVLRMLGEYFAAFPDLEFQLEETIIDSDRIVRVWTANGTHQGSVMNIPPTGRRVSVRGVSVLTLKEGQVKDGLYIWDVAGLLRSLGLLPELQA